MSRRAVPLLVLVFLMAPAAPLGAGTEVLTVDPLADKDLNHFEKKGAWAIDDTSDDVHTLIVCPTGKEDQTLRYRMRTFPQGFQVAMEVKGGSKRKGIEFWIVPEKGDWIQVPFSARFIMKEAWHEFTVTVEKGQAFAKVAGEEGEKVAVPTDQPLTFAIKVLKRSEAVIRKVKIKFLVVSEEQRAPEADFVRIFDGKSLDGWKVFPEGSTSFKLAEQRIEGKNPMEAPEAARLAYTDGAFQDFVLRFRAAQGAKNLIAVARPNSPDGKVPEVTTVVESYFTSDTDWNDVELSVVGQQVTLSVNGNQKWAVTTPNTFPWTAFIALGRDGSAIIRDIRIKGQNIQPGPSWPRYCQESGAAPGAAPPPGGAGGGGQPGVEQGGRGAPDSITLFNGTDLTDWQPMPPACWSVGEGKIVGLTLDQDSPAQIVYTRLLFSDFRLVFKIQRGTAGAKFVARAYPAEAKKGAAVMDLKAEWMNPEAEWTEFEAEAFGPKMTLKAGGKVVGEFMIPEEQAVLGFVIDKRSAIGVKDITWYKPARR